jgi:hypothetical protein
MRSETSTCDVHQPDRTARGLPPRRDKQCNQVDHPVFSKNGQIQEIVRDCRE